MSKKQFIFKVILWIVCWVSSVFCMVLSVIAVKQGFMIDAIYNLIMSVWCLVLLVAVLRVHDSLSKKEVTFADCREYEPERHQRVLT